MAQEDTSATGAQLARPRARAADTAQKGAGCIENTNLAGLAVTDVAMPFIVGIESDDLPELVFRTPLSLADTQDILDGRDLVWTPETLGRVAHYRDTRTVAYGASPLATGRSTTTGGE